MRYAKGALVMPIYVYGCLDCGKVEDYIQKMSDPPMEECEHCNGALQKMLTTPSVHVKDGPSPNQRSSQGSRIPPPVAPDPRGPPPASDLAAIKKAAITNGEEGYQRAVADINKKHGF